MNNTGSMSLFTILSKKPIPLCLFLIIVVAPAIFVLGFGLSKAHSETPQNETNTITIPVKKITEISAQSGETIYIYADVFTIYREDAIYRVEDTNGKEIAVTPLYNQKQIAYQGRISDRFAAIASFMTEGESVYLFCDNSNDAQGEFFIAPKISVSSFSLLSLLVFAIGATLLFAPAIIAIKSIYRWAKTNSSGSAS